MAEVPVDPLVDSVRSLFSTYFVPSIRAGSESAARDAESLLSQGIPNPPDLVKARTLLEAAKSSNEALDQLYQHLGTAVSKDSAEIMSRVPLDPKTLEGLNTLRGIVQKSPKVDLPEDIIPRRPVESSNLSSVAYDPKSKLLQVQFNNGQIYEYKDVPEEKYVGLMAAHEATQEPPTGSHQLDILPNKLHDKMEADVDLSDSYFDQRERALGSYTGNTPKQPFYDLKESAFMKDQLTPNASEDFPFKKSLKGAPKEFTKEQAADVLVAATGGDYGVISPVPGPYTDRQLGRMLMQNWEIHQHYYDSQTWTDKQLSSMPKSLDDWEKLAKYFREKGLIENTHDRVLTGGFGGYLSGEMRKDFATDPTLGGVSQSQPSVGEYFSKNIAKAYKYTKRFPIPVAIGALTANQLFNPPEAEAGTGKVDFEALKTLLGELKKEVPNLTTNDFRLFITGSKESGAALGLDYLTRHLPQVPEDPSDAIEILKSIQEKIGTTPDKIQLDLQIHKEPNPSLKAPWSWAPGFEATITHPDVSIPLAHIQGRVFENTATISASGIGPDLIPNMKGILNNIKSQVKEAFPYVKTVSIDRISGANPTHRAIQIGAGAAAIGAGTVLVPDEAQALGPVERPGPSTSENQLLTQYRKQEFPFGGVEPVERETPYDPRTILQTPEGPALIHPSDIHVPPITDLTSRPEYKNASSTDQLQMKLEWWKQFGSQDPRILAIAQQRPEAIPRIRAALLGLPDPTNLPFKLAYGFVRGLTSPLDSLLPSKVLNQEAELMGQPSTIPYIAGQMGAFVTGGSLWRTGARLGLPLIGKVLPSVLKAGKFAGIAGQITGDALMQGSFEASQLFAQKKALLERTAVMDTMQEELGPSSTQNQLATQIQQEMPTIGGAFAHGATTGAMFDVAMRSILGTGAAAWGKYALNRDLKRIAAGDLPKGTRAQDLEHFMITQDPVLDPASHIAQEGLATQPEIAIKPGAPTRIFLKDGTQVSVKDLNLGRRLTGEPHAQDYWDTMLQTRYTDEGVKEMLGTPVQDALDRGWVKKAGGKRPLYQVTEKYVAEAPPGPSQAIGWSDVARVEGSQHYVNNLFEQMGQEMPIESAPARALGADIFRVRDKYVVRLAGESPYVLDNTDQLAELLHGLSTGGIIRIENKALQNLTEQGINGFKLFQMIGGGAGQHIRDLADMAEHQMPPPNVPPEWRLAAGRFVRPRKATFLSAEEASRPGKGLPPTIPVYSKVYEPVEEALLKRRVALEPVQAELHTLLKKMSKSDREGYGLLLETPPDTPAFQKVMDEFKLDRAKYDKIMDWTDRFFKTLGLDAKDYFQQQLPKIRTSGDPYTAYGDVLQMPPETRFFLDHMMNNRLGTFDAHPSVEKILTGHMFQGSWQRDVAPAYGAAKDWYNSLTTPFGPRPGANITPGTAILVKNYLDDLVGVSSGTDRELMQAIGNTWLHFRRAAVRRGEEVVSKQEAQEAGQHLFGWLYAHNYSANLAFRPGAVMRQYLQTVQTTLPRIGYWATNKGILKAVTREGQDLVHRSGLLVEEAPFAGAEGVQTIGGKIFRRADNIQRAIAGLGQDSLFQKHLSTYTRGGNWDQFIQRSAIEKFHPIVIGRVKQLIDSGDIMGARLRLMREVSEDTQWIYRRANQPEFFRGLGGRLFGQYGIWPAYYGEYLGQMLSRGSVRGRVGQSIRWLESQAILYGTLKTVLGADATSWLFLGPLQFQGGPFFQVGLDILRAPGGGPEANLAKSRLETQTLGGKGKVPLGQVVPGAAAMKDLYDALHTTNGQDLARELLGFQKAR